MQTVVERAAAAAAAATALAEAHAAAAAALALLAARPHILVDLDCAYTRGLVLEAVACRGSAVRTTVLPARGDDDGEGADAGREAASMRAQADACNAAAGGSVIAWAEYEHIDWDLVSASALGASAYCYRKGLIRKALLDQNCRRYIAKRPGCKLAAALPETYPFELHHADYLEEALSDLPEVRDMADGSATWIAKPSLMNQAHGILVFDTCAAFAEHVTDPEHESLREWVVQRYIASPLLLGGGRKWHLRAYALCVGRMKCYVYSEGLLLFAAAPYTGAPMTDEAAHLTNTCRAAAARAQTPDGTGNALVFPQSALAALLATERGMPLVEAADIAAHIAASANAIVGEAVEAACGDLSFGPLNGCFEHFGFDLMVDAAFNVWLLEANAEPDFAQTGPSLRAIVAGVVEGTLRLVLDPLLAGQNGPPREEAQGPGRFVEVFSLR